MKRFTRIEPTIVQTYGLQYPRKAVVKNFRDDEGIEHEFSTVGEEGSRAGAVIALTPDKRVITLYQFRPGPERWMYDIPGGGFYDGEDQEVAVIRELKEETGYEPGRIEYLGESCYDAYINMARHYFIATGCVLSKDGIMHDKEEAEQGAEVRLISIDELIDNARQARMTDPGAVLLAYDMLMKLKEMQ